MYRDLAFLSLVLCAGLRLRAQGTVGAVDQTGRLFAATRGQVRAPAFSIGAGGHAAGLILRPLRATTTEYLFLFSVLPGLWPWLGRASGLAGAGLGAAALATGRAAG